MKCGHPACGRGIGLVSQRRWFDSRLYCSKACRDNYAARPRQTIEKQAADESILAALFKLPTAPRRPDPGPAVVRVRAR